MPNLVFNPWTGKLDFIGKSTGSGGNGAFTGFLLVDSNGIHWFITIDTTGHLVTSIVSGIPAGAYYPNSFVLQDTSAANWTVTIDTTGHLITTSGGSNSAVIRTFILNDSTGRSWIVTIDTSGHLVTA